MTMFKILNIMQQKWRNFRDRQQIESVLRLFQGAEKE